ncbi:MAG: hypothetical protein AB7O26_02980 [Planctomycetaceae bacterium]
MKSGLAAFMAIVLAASSAIAADQYKLGPAEKLPEGVAAPFASLLDPKGYEITGPSGAVSQIWLVKELAVRASFKPTLSVKYPLIPGSLVGVMSVAPKSPVTDFRGTSVKPGLYTLRYGQQPEDGNHLGTSEVADFLLAVPAAFDKDPKPITLPDKLHKESAKASGTTHPAIFSLLPPEDAVKEATLAHEEEKQFWILTVTAQGHDKSKKVAVPLRLVTIGKAEG